MYTSRHAARDLHVTPPLGCMELEFSRMTHDVSSPLDAELQFDLARLDLTLQMTIRRQVMAIQRGTFSSRKALS